MARLLLLFMFLCCAGLLAIWIFSVPSNDRDWQDEVRRLVTVLPAQGDAVTLRDIRNWSYAPDGSTTQEVWIDRVLRISDLKQAWFVVEPFWGNPAIAHTMFAFEFADGTAYVVSIEARKEVGERYRPLRATLLPTYEYMLVWATERDMYANSEFVTENSLYLYRLAIPLGQQQALLRAMTGKTAELAEHPRWYNTVFANCTNVLARVVNDLQPGTVPFDISWVLPGYSDSFLHRLGYFGPDQDFEALERAAYLSPFIRPAYAETDPARFSQLLRQLQAEARG